MARMGWVDANVVEIHRHRPQRFHYGRESPAREDVHLPAKSKRISEVDLCKALQSAEKSKILFGVKEP